MKTCSLFVVIFGVLFAGCAGNHENVKAKDSKESVDSLIKAKVASLGKEYDQPRILNNLSPELFQPGFPHEMSDSFADYTFYKITLYFDKNGESRLIAFNKTNDKLFILPREIKDIHFPHHDNPIIMAKIYTILATPPGDGMVFISSKNDINGIQNSPHVEAMVINQVVEPTIVKHSGGTDVILYTWQKIGGIIKKWRIKFDDDGKMQLIHPEEIADRVGNFVMRY